MSLLLEIITWALIPAGILPVLTMLVIRRYRHADSESLRDRWRLAVVMAALGAVTSFLAIAALFDLELGEPLWIAFGLALIAADVVSGRWLLDYWSGRFES